MSNVISGGISGAISDPFSPEAQLHAYKYYEEIRHRTDDIYKIAKLTGYTPEQVLKAKNFLFVETHVLSDGIRRFDPSFEIAESWQRLSDMQEFVQEHDKLLIPHELMEMKLINDGLSQEEAHNKTSEVYNYPDEADKFYQELQREKGVISKSDDKETDDTISGGIEHRQSHDDWGLFL